MEGCVSGGAVGSGQTVELPGRQCTSARARNESEVVPCVDSTAWCQRLRGNQGPRLSRVQEPSYGQPKDSWWGRAGVSGSVL